MKAEPTIEDLLRKWMKEDRIDEALLEIQLALDEYHEMAGAGTQRDRVKRADENLHEIELHARALSEAIAAMPVRAKWAILEHRNSTGETGAIARWLSDLYIVREDMLLPLADTAKGALGCLPGRPRRGRVKKIADSPRDALVHRLAVLYRDAGAEGVRHRGDESLVLTFVRELLEHLDINLPDDLARVLRSVTANKSKTI